MFPCGTMDEVRSHVRLDLPHLTVRPTQRLFPSLSNPILERPLRRVRREARARKRHRHWSGGIASKRLTQTGQLEKRTSLLPSSINGLVSRKAVASAPSKSIVWNLASSFDEAFAAPTIGCCRRQGSQYHFALKKFLRRGEPMSNPQYIYAKNRKCAFVTYDLASSRGGRGGSMHFSR